MQKFHPYINVPGSVYRSQLTVKNIARLLKPIPRLAESRD